MSRLRLVFFLFSTLLSGASMAAEPSIYTLVTNGPTANRLNIVIMGDGYTAGQVAAFTNHARGIAAKLLSTAPYSAYSNYFNAFAIFAASNESGSDHPSRNPPVYRDTYFNSSYDSYGIARLLTIPPNDRNSNYGDGAGKVSALLQEFVPEYDIVLILVNDLQYGGSGGTYAVTSVEASSAEIAIHEIGHSYAALGDEYDDPAPGYPDIEAANTTRETRRDFIKWNDWIELSTPVPTPETSAYANHVGLFEGAHYHSSGWYRPKLDCKMKTLGRPFCEVCSEALVLSGYRRLNMFDSRHPARSAITTWPGGNLLFRVEGLGSAQNPLSYRWFLNGMEVEDSGANEFLLVPERLVPGLHELSVQSTDPTDLVRNDPFGDLIQQTSWTIDLQPSPPEIFAFPVRLQDNILQLEFESSLSGDLILENSKDLKQWSPVSSNTASTTLSFDAPVSPELPREFFRLRVEPAE